MTEFNEIIDFAISREKEAINFYKSLQEMAKFVPQKQVLEDFEKMERGHVELLEGVKKRHGFKKKSPPAVDLKLGDYLVDVDAKPDMNYQDILILAIKKEKRSMELYSRLVEESGGSEEESVFQQLFTEEANHKSHFERIYDEEILSDN